jgi:hypothetical protein
MFRSPPQFWCTALAATLVVLVASMLRAEAQEVWFSPSPHSPDFLDLFQSDAPWQRAASSVKGFEIPDSLIYNHQFSDSSLIQMFSDLRRRNIGVVVGIGAVTGQGRGRCGYLVEGYGQVNSLPGDARRMRSLGLEPAFFSLDEPLYFGHFFDRDRERVGCRLPIERLAQDVATKLRQIRSVFPNARFGDVEPFPLVASKEGDWISDLGKWLDVYRNAAGENLAFFRLDVAWNLDWRSSVPSLLRLLQSRNIPLQVIYNGSGLDRSDGDWIANAASHYQSFETASWPPPSVAMIQSWNRYPTRILPEIDPNTMVGLVNRYVHWQSSLK